MEKSNVPNVNILVIDDHKMICEGIISFLSKNGFNNIVFSATSSNECLNQLQEKFGKEFNFIDSDVPFIAIIDVRLGNENGLELASILGKMGIRCIMYSMFKSPSYILKSMEVGAFGYVLKDQNEKDLVDAISSVAKNEKYMSYDLMYSANNLLRIIVTFTKKERAVFDLAIEDNSVAEISQKLAMSKRTVENHLSSIYSKTNCTSREEIRKKFGA